MKRIRFRIGNSGIHGRGAFATEQIRKGTRILEYTGELVDAEEAECRAEKAEHVWLFDLDDGMFIDGNPQAPGSCVNHSCNPNCYTLIDGHRVFIIAERGIKPGEELTYDYQFEPDMETWPCRCGAPKCRGTINLKPRKKRNRNGSQ
jgi:SET domain-containing protein